jgi:hypothetical protein
MIQVLEYTARGRPSIFGRKAKLAFLTQSLPRRHNPYYEVYIFFHTFPFLD